MLKCSPSDVRTVFCCFLLGVICGMVVVIALRSLLYCAWVEQVRVVSDDFIVAVF